MGRGRVDYEREARVMQRVCYVFLTAREMACINKAFVIMLQVPVPRGGRVAPVMLRPLTDTQTDRENRQTHRQTEWYSACRTFLVKGCRASVSTTPAGHHAAAPQFAEGVSRGAQPLTPAVHCRHLQGHSQQPLGAALPWGPMCCCG